MRGGAMHKVIKAPVLKKNGRSQKPAAKAEQKVSDPAADEFKAKLISLFQEVHLGEDKTPLKSKEQKALREAKIADLFEERLQTMLLDGILKQLQDSGQKFDEAALQELQTRLFNARSSKDLIQWPVPRMERAWYIQDFVDDLMTKGKKSADEMSELTGSVVKGAMAQAKAFAAVSELIDGAMLVFKEQGVQLLKGNVPNLIKLKILENSALMQKTAVDATTDLKVESIPEAVEKVQKGFEALNKPPEKGAATGGTRRRKHKRRRTQRYRARFTAADFF